MSCRGGGFPLAPVLPPTIEPAVKPFDHRAALTNCWHCQADSALWWSSRARPPVEDGRQIMRNWRTKCPQFLYLVILISITLSGCWVENERYDRELNDRIRAKLQLPNGGEVDPAEILRVVNSAVEINEPLESVQEKMEQFGFDHEPWNRCSWNSSSNTWVCEIFITRRKHRFDSQECIGVIFQFDNSKRLSKVEALPYELRP